jgi:hypothetical protein
MVSAKIFAIKIFSAALYYVMMGTGVPKMCHLARHLLKMHGGSTSYLKVASLKRNSLSSKGKFQRA